MNKKVLVLMPDGVSLRNFAYTSFYKLGIEKDFDIVFWNATPFNLQEIGYNEIKIENPKPRPITDLLKSARIQIELKLYSKRDKDSVYQSYIFPLSFKSLKATAKSLFIKWYTKRYASESGLEKIRHRIIASERKSEYYKNCLEVLKKEKPDFVFCTSQRSVIAIAPLAAAQELKIPTASFIFSWDNLPKATTVVTTDYYFVWSEHMKRELLHYQKYVSSEQVLITGTPQFENHFTDELLETKDTFFTKHRLNLTREYICFSGDDVTTSQTDQLYLRDVAKAVRKLNKDGHNMGVIFRRCPVDFSDRYDEVIETYNDVIVPIAPAWEKMGEMWNTILPTKADLKLQTNIIAHSVAVVNLGSSMVFDYAAHKKPCAFINYNYLNSSQQPEKGVYVYNFVHFRSMPAREAVVWFSDPETIAEDLLAMLKAPAKTVIEAKKWFEVINLHPPQEASKRIWNTIIELI
ncbi:UDP-glycosyltransferase [Ulvibacter litoralis]|uniref:Monogalactosyldiacylglycerol (MGDG) synthase n=1 Tax=Ulvibacter litoralis TaxID=227084 RepID=A0A1G7GW64_9FLAO|nr:UDP-glycosyltransferase [Ulvibacter litoralis]GHC59914.1 hypothetical protein GCM10008083_26110 [Ulvibacter litoralis]SDE92345.1 Monogalactosyldiacylglycerol (MGDG) synthase [Ulvibacter litoralis]